MRKLDGFEPGALTVLIGPNGAGKSNFISFFRLLSWALTPPDGLQRHVGQLGGAGAILHDGPEATREISAEITLETDAGANDYAFRLFYAAGDTLVFAEEKFRFSDASIPGQARWTSLDAGHREPRLTSRADGGDQTARTILRLLRKIVIHQFHNTSQTARMRTKWDVEESRWLKEDAGNLAPFLFRLQNDQPEYYRRVVETLRLSIPYFADFELTPEYGRVLLRWRERGSDKLFNAADAADGMLRLMALVALLQQPESDLPDVLILDEPELGLHPFAIGVVAGLVRSASKQVQVIIATQSTSLLDRFEPQDVVIVDRKDRESTFRRLGADEFRDWLEEYSLSELWEKNLLGGRP